MTDKLDIINDALALTGNAIRAAVDDGSDEWTTASIAYEAAVGWLIQEHNWGFGTAIATATRSGDSPDEAYEDAYAKPSGSFAIVWVKLNGLPVEYRIIGGQICLTANDGTVTVKYVEQPSPDSWPPLFVQALRCQVMAGCYRGLNEDVGSANQEEAKAENFLQRARTRTDQEQPKRSLFSSRLRNSRMIRRPWARSPRDFGGIGS